MGLFYGSEREVKDMAPVQRLVHRSPRTRLITLADDFSLEALPWSSSPMIRNLCAIDSPSDSKATAWREARYAAEPRQKGL